MQQKTKEEISMAPTETKDSTSLIIIIEQASEYGLAVWQPSEQPRS